MLWHVSGPRFETRTSEYGGLLIIILPDLRDQFRMCSSEVVELCGIEIRVGYQEEQFPSIFYSLWQNNSCERTQRNAIFLFSCLYSNSSHIT
jgi:hypothetical protein